MIIIYVQDGFVQSATSGAKNGKDAVNQALHLPDASYHWIRGVQPPDPIHSIFLNIKDFLSKSGNIYKSKLTETSRLSGKALVTADDSQYKYFLIPERQPTAKHYLTQTATTLGRDHSSDLVLDDSNVSGRHCILDIHKRGLFILDLDSTNGTYVNGVLVKDGYLNPGDVIELGDYRLMVNRELKT